MAQCAIAIGGDDHYFAPSTCVAVDSIGGKLNSSRAIASTCESESLHFDLTSMLVPPFCGNLESLDVGRKLDFNSMLLAQLPFNVRLEDRVPRLLGGD
jgi:hypothetical protein